MMKSVARSPGAPPSVCPKISSSDVLGELRKAFAKMCPPGSQVAQQDPFCASLYAASDVGDLVKRLKHVDRRTWHTWWSQPPGSDMLLGIVSTAQLMRCLSSKHNTDVMIQVGNLKDWYFDDLLMTVADFDPIKRSGAFTPKDAIQVQTSFSRAFCSGAPQTAVGVGLFILGVVIGAAVLGIIWGAVSSKNK